jgi:hypothetical protein
METPMTLLEAIAPYRDPDTGLVNLHPNITGRDSDNGLLFTATARVVFGYPGIEEFRAIVARCEIFPGYYSRYPGDPEPTSWDDLIGLSVADTMSAQSILDYASKHDWSWGDKWLGRIPLLQPTVLAGAGVKLSLFSQAKAGACFIQNTFEPVGETSGACLLFLASQVLEGRGAIVDLAIHFWRWRMQRKYPRGIAEVYATYFGPQHPYALFAPTNFERVTR